VRQPKRKDAKPIAMPNRFRSDQTVHRIDQDVNDLPRDWSELGRRVLAEAMRRSMREFRRRNGCRAKGGGMRRRAEGRS
jgi:hypothetical protein